MTVYQPRSVLFKVNVVKTRPKLHVRASSRHSFQGWRNWVRDTFALSLIFLQRWETTSRWNTGAPLQLRGPFFLLPFRVLVNMCWCDQERAQWGDILCWGAGEGAGTMISAGRKGRENPTNEGLIDSNTQPMWPWENSVAFSLSKRKKALWSFKTLPDTPAPAAAHTWITVMCLFLPVVEPGARPFPHDFAFHITSMQGIFPNPI